MRILSWEAGNHRVTKFKWTARAVLEEGGGACRRGMRKRRKEHDEAGSEQVSLILFCDHISFTSPAYALHCFCLSFGCNSIFWMWIFRYNCHILEGPWSAEPSRLLKRQGNLPAMNPTGWKKMTWASLKAQALSCFDARRYLFSAHGCCEHWEEWKCFTLWISRATFKKVTSQILLQQGKGS